MGRGQGRRGGPVTGSASRLIARMRFRAADAIRELVLAAVVLIGLSRLVDPPYLWAVAILLLVAVVVGTLQVFGEAEARGGPTDEGAGVPIESLMLPALAAFGCLGALRPLPIGLALLPALAAAWWLIDRVVTTEERIVVTGEHSTRDRTALLTLATIVAFVAFAGLAALVPGGLAEPVATRPAAPIFGPDLAALVIGDALIAGLVGYRVAALRLEALIDVAWSAASYAVIAAIGVTALRGLGIPRLVGPAALVVLLFVWDAFHGAPPALRRHPHRLIEAAVLIVVAGVVVVWSLNVRG